MSGLLAIDPGEPRAREAVEEKQARCPKSKGPGLEWAKFYRLKDALRIGVERDFVFYQEFLIPGASVGILECTHFSELL